MTGASASPPTAIPTACNQALVLGVAGANLLLLLGVPLLLHHDQIWAAWLAAVFVLVTVPHWALVHEAVHGHLHPSAGANAGLGRLLAILFLAPFDTLKFGHLSHHALNARATEGPEFYDPAVRSHFRATVVFYLRLLIGVYLLELTVSLLSLLPRQLLRPIVRRVFYEGEPDGQAIAERAERTLPAPAVLTRIRIDAAIILCLLSLSAHAYGHWWPVLALALLGRGAVVSVIDNAPHHDGPLAQPDQGFDMRLPLSLDRLLLHSNLHGTRHRYPNLPWKALPAAFHAEGGHYAGSYFVLPLRQLKGPRPIHPPTPGPST